MIKYYSLFIAILLSLISYGQVNNSSPYSYFGIGDFNQQNTVASSSMGGLSLSISSLKDLNFKNPAANSQLSFSVLSIAGKTNYLTVDDGTTKQNASATTLSYVAMGIPFGEKGGFIIGLQPNSNVGYAVKEEILDTDDSIIEVNIYNGKGGTNRFFGSFGYKIYEGLSLGLEGEYIFGKVENDLIKQKLNVVRNTHYNISSNLSGVGVKLGAQYQKEINGIEMKSGLSVKLANKLNATSSENTYSFSYNSNGFEQIHDTLEFNSDVSGKITRPLEWAVGVGAGKPNVWYAGVDYTSQNALSFDGVLFSNNKVKYEPSSKLSVGGFWIPKTNSISSYWKRITYRAGVRFESTGLALNTTGNLNDFTSIKDFGISFGLGLPIGHKLSQVNLGFEYGNRGNTTNGLIKENYFNLRLGLNLADKWFHKRKIN